MPFVRQRHNHLDSKAFHRLIVHPDEHDPATIAILDVFRSLSAILHGERDLEQLLQNI